MRNLREDKKGFTLVELLAVIVILALIMSIAVISMGGVMQSARESTYKQSAASIIEAVRNQLTVSQELYKHNGNSWYNEYVTYFFTKEVLDRQVDAPFGGAFRMLDITPDTAALFKKIGTGVYIAIDSDGNSIKDSNRTCFGSLSFVQVIYNNTNKSFEYKICLTSSANNDNDLNYPYIFATEVDLLNGKAEVLPVPATE